MSKFEMAEAAKSRDLRAPDPLRPKTLEEFAGQPEVTKHLRIILGAANARGELSEHILFSGPPGTGKTTLSHIISETLEMPLIVTSGPALERPGDLVMLLTRMSTPSVVFIDEIHRLNRATEEHLYPAMEDGVVDLVVSEGADVESVRIDILPFVLVGATTQAGMLTAPLRDRFGYHGRLSLYDPETLSKIVERSAGLLGMGLDAEAGRVIAERSQGTPRIANRLLRRVRDWVQMEGMPAELAERGGEWGDIEVTAEMAAEALEAFGVDALGLDATARELLEVLTTARDGQPIGLNQVASLLGEDPRTIEEMYEPYLLKLRLIARTQRGRVATAAGYRHIGKEPPATGDVATLPGI